MSQLLLRLSISACALIASYASLIAVPQNNLLDPAPIHSLAGSDNYFKSSTISGEPLEICESKGELPIAKSSACKQTRRAFFSIDFSPFYLHTATTSIPGSGKAPASNIYGTYNTSNTIPSVAWNMGALFFNQPSTIAINNTTYPNYYAAQQAMRQFPINGANASPYNIDYTNPNTYNISNPNVQAATYQYVPLALEKIGVRSKIAFDFTPYFSIVARGGAAQIKQAVVGCYVQGDANLVTNAQGDLTTPSPTPQNVNAYNLYSLLMSDDGRVNVAKDLGYNLRSFKKGTLEDLHVAAQIHAPIPMYENDDVVVYCVPYVSIGSWVPLAYKKDQNNPFSLPAGSDGHLGLTAECGINLDFPNMLQASFGGGVVMYQSKDFANYRVPTHQYQTGLIPWKTSITKQPGATWYLNASMKAENFVSKKDVPNFSFFFDYIYIEHMHDSIKLREINPTTAQAFMPQVLEQRSAYKTQQLYGGISCAITSNIGFGIGAQGTVSSSRCYRPTTLIWNLYAKV